MSMISAQIDELRELAGDGSMEWVACPIRASVLRDAADTIWQLRGDLQRANAENIRLRSELESVGTASYLYGRSDLKAENTKLIVKLNAEHIVRQNVEIENAKLRELVRDMNKAAHMLCEAWEGSCSKEAEGMSLHAVCPISDTNELCVFGKLYDRVRELGVEVE